MNSNRSIKPEDYRSSEPDPSREVDLIMNDLEIVLRCQCCAPTNAPFRVEVWDSDLASAQEISVIADRGRAGRDDIEPGG
jgi:hypothetical protein